MGIKEKLNLSDEDVQKPIPVPSKWTMPFWEAAKNRKLIIKKCKNCGHLDHPPYPYCTNCGEEDHEWVEASGKAKLVAYTINVFGVPFPFWDDMPYVVAMVDLEEGPRMMTNIVECDHDKLKTGMALKLVFEDLSDEITLPKFMPA